MVRTTAARARGDPGSRRAVGSSSTGWWLVAHQRACAALLLALFVLIYLFPALLGGDVLSPASTLYQIAPWRSQAPADWTNYLNFILGDVPMSHYPWNEMARGFIHDGAFPAWSQHAYAGTPFFANPQTILLSPLALPLWILPLNYALGVMAAIKLWLTAFGTYLLVRELRLGFWPGILAGISYTLCAFNVVWLAHETLVSVAVMLPWLIWLIERTVRGGSLGAAVALAPVTAVALTGGHPGTEVHVMLAAGIYALVRAGVASELVTRDRLVRGGLTVGGMALGALIVAVLIIPVVKSGQGTLGAEGRMGGNTEIPGGDMRADVLRTALFPDWWGRPSNLSLDGPANYNERTFYAGGLALIFAVLALVSPGAWRRKAPFAVLGLLGLLIPVHAPGLYWLAVNLPILGQVQPQRILLLFVFAIPVLAAFGLQRMIDNPEDRVRQWSVIGAGAFAGIVALASSSLSGDDIGQALGNVARLRHAVGGLVSGTPPNVGGMIATSVTWWLVLVAAAALAFWAFTRWPHRRNAIVVGLVLFAAVDMLYFAGGYQPMAPASKVFPDSTPAIAYLQEHRDDGRFVGIDSAMSNGWASTYGLRDVRGYDPPQPSMRWYRLWRVLNWDQSDWAQFDTPMPGPDGLNILGVLGARYVVTDPGIERPRELRALEDGHVGDDANVFVNTRAVPRTMVAERIAASANEDETIATIADETFDPRTTVVVERSEPGAAALRGADGTVAVTDEDSSSVTLDAELDRPGLVVLNDALAPGWTVAVDGSAADVVRVNSVMRGVAVDAGRHEVVWSYEVPGLKTGMGVSVLGLVALLSACVGLLLHRRKQQRSSDGEER